MEKSVIFIVLLLLAPYPTTLQGAPRKRINKLQPCKRFVLYFHDILFSGDNAMNATSYATANSSGIGLYQFGKVVVFDNPMTADQQLGMPPVARAHGIYFYNMKDFFNAWFAFNVVFNSTDYNGTIDIVGDNIFAQFYGPIVPYDI